MDIHIITKISIHRSKPRVIEKKNQGYSEIETTGS